MDTDKIALTAMIVAIVAALIAFWQASEARGARKIAREQADTAKDALEQATRQSAAAEKSATAAMLSLNAAERAAGAAEEQVVEARKAVRAAEDQVVQAREQVELTRQQLDETRDERDARTVIEQRDKAFAVLTAARDLTEASRGLTNTIRNTYAISPGFGRSFTTRSRGPYADALKNWERAVMNSLGQLPPDQVLNEALGNFVTAHLALDELISGLVGRVTQGGAVQSGDLDNEFEEMKALYEDLVESCHTFQVETIRAVVPNDAAELEARGDAEG